MDEETLAFLQMFQSLSPDQRKGLFANLGPSVQTQNSNTFDVNGNLQSGENFLDFTRNNNQFQVNPTQGGFETNLNVGSGNAGAFGNGDIDRVNALDAANANGGGTNTDLTTGQKFGLGFAGIETGLGLYNAYESRKARKNLEEQFDYQKQLDKINVGNQVELLNTQYADLGRLRASRGQSAPSLNLQTLG